MSNVLQQFASTEGSGDVMSSLGIDWKMLVLQGVAFVILVYLLNKFVFPPLMKAVDDRQAAIEASTEAAKEAEEKAAAAQDEIKAALKEAQQEARDIVETAKDEANAKIADAEEKAKARSEKIIKDAHDQLEKDVIAARKSLHNDTIDLVALATEKVVGKAVSGDVDKKIIAEAVKENA